MNVTKVELVNKFLELVLKFENRICRGEGRETENLKKEK